MPDINIEIIKEKLKHAKNRFAESDSFRVFHGRGQTYAGFEYVVIDFFKPALLITVYKEPPENVLLSLVNFVRDELLGEHINCLLIQRRDLKEYSLKIMLGALPENFYASRKQQLFKLASEQQNVGYFLDIEPARRWLENNARDKSVLNLFAFTCSFSVISIAAGASSVVNVDMNRSALNTGRDNHRLNQLQTDRVKFLAHEILRSWGKLTKLGPYDIVIVDPPSNQKGSFVALKDYPKVIKKIPALLCEGGLALLCLNAPEISCMEFQKLIDECEVPLAFQEVLPVDLDFPDKYDRGLKMLVYRVESGLCMPPL